MDRARRFAVAQLRRYWLLLLALAALTGLVLAVNPAKLADTFKHLQLESLVLMAPIVLVIYVFRALGWRVALRHLGIRVGVVDSLLVVFAGRPLTFVPGGDLARVALLKLARVEEHNGGEVVATIAFQELLYLTLMGLAVIPALPAYPGVGSIVGLLLLLDVAIYGVLVWDPAYQRARSAAEHWGFLRRYHSELGRLRPAFLRLFRLRPLAGVAFFNAAAVALSFLLFKQCLAAVGAGGVGYASAAFTYALAHILAGLSMLPGGLGAYEGLLTGFMALQGIPPAQGATAAILYRLFNDGFVALVGLGAATVLYRRRGERRPEAAAPAAR